MQNRSDPTRRFSDRVADYVRHRPRYPRELMPVLRKEIGVAPEWLVADIGSGTGFSSEPFLQNGNRVIGVEPNQPMRAAAGELLAQWTTFESRDGTAEDTGIPDHTIDLIVAGQAFHWFDTARARPEFVRILRPGGWLLIMWNRRHTDTTPFLRAYETLLLRYGTDYQDVRHDRLSAEYVSDFFGHAVQSRVLPYTQVFDFEGLKGRLLSSSYVPAADDPGREPMLNELRQLFDEYQDNGHVRCDYDTELYFGRLE